MGVPPLKVRIGIHAGEVVAGTMGAEQQMSYTIIGDTVNTAARLEPLNKELKTEILISEVIQQKLPPDIHAANLWANWKFGAERRVFVLTAYPRINLQARIPYIGRAIWLLATSRLLA